MNKLALLLSLCTGLIMAGDVELKVLSFTVVEDQRAYQRAIEDKRSCVWTDSVAESAKLLETFGFAGKKPALKEGQVLAVFLNDWIHEDLTGIVFNNNMSETFADFADSGLRVKMVAPAQGKKYSHLTAVIFTPEQPLKTIGLRRPVDNAVAEKFILQAK